MFTSAIRLVLFAIVLATTQMSASANAGALLAHREIYYICGSLQFDTKVPLDVRLQCSSSRAFSENVTSLGELAIDESTIPAWQDVALAVIKKQIATQVLTPHELIAKCKTEDSPWVCVYQHFNDSATFILSQHVLGVNFSERLRKVLAENVLRRAQN